MCPYSLDLVADAVLAQEEHHLAVPEHRAGAELQQDVAGLQADLVGEPARFDVGYFGARTGVEERAPSHASGWMSRWRG